MKVSYLRMLLRAAAVVIGMLLSACTTGSTMKSWVGAPERELIASWGAPDRTVKLPDGAKLDTWITKSPSKSGVHSCEKTFTVDSQGKVTESSYRGCGFLSAVLRDRSRS